MIAGYVVIFGLMGLFIASLVTRVRNLKKDMEMLDELKKELNEMKTKAQPASAEPRIVGPTSPGASGTAAAPSAGRGPR